MSTEMFTSLPSTEAAELTDIICAVQGYTGSSNLGLSVQESLQQIYDLFSKNIIQSNAGNPNGQLAGTSYGLVWDTTNNIAWVCTTTGTATTAVWKPIIGALTNGQIRIGSTGNAPVAATIQSSNSNIVVTSGPGSITLTGVASGTTNTGNVGDIAYYPATGTSVSGFSASDNATFYTNSAGQLQSTVSMTNGDLLIGSTGAAPVLNKLIGDGGITIIEGPGSITIDGSGAGSGSVNPGLTGQLAYYPANDTVVDGFAANNSAIFYTNSTGQIQSTTSLTDGQLVIGNTGNSPTVGTLTGAGTVTVTQGPGTITITGSGGTSNIDNATIINNTSLGYNVQTPTTTAMDSGFVFEVSPLFTIGSNTYFAVAGRPYLQFFTYNGTTATSFQLISTATSGNIFPNVVVYTISGITYVTALEVTGAVCFLNTYTFNGTQFVLTGTPTTVATTQALSMQYFVIAGTSYIAVGSSGENFIYLNSWNGTTYQAVGSPIPTSGLMYYKALIYSVIGSTPTLTAGILDTGLSVYQWNGTTFALVEAQVLPNSFFLFNMQQFVSGGNNYVMVVSGNGSTYSAVQLYQWNTGLNRYVLSQLTAFQANASIFNGTTTYLYNSSQYFSVVRAQVGQTTAAYLDTYLFSGTAFSLISTVGIAGGQYTLNNGLYNGQNYLLVGALTTVQMLQQNTSGFLQAGIVQPSSGGTGLNVTPTNGQLLIGNTSLKGYSLASLTPGAGINITRGSGSITIAASGPTFTGSVGSYTSNALSILPGTTGFTTTASGIANSITLGGTLIPANGGTGLSTLPTNGQLLIGNTATNGYALTTLTAGTNVSIVNSAGSITISASGGGSGVTLNADVGGSVSGSDLTLTGGETGLTTDAFGTTIRLNGVLGSAFGGTGVNSKPFDGQLLIGNTSTESYDVVNLTEGSGISIINGPGSITISSTGNYLTWIETTSATINPMVAGTGYITNYASGTLQYTLPATAAVGSVIGVAGNSADGWQINTQSGQSIVFEGVAVTTSLSSSQRYNSVQLLCITANTVFSVINVVGNLTVV